jgi:Icc-related predicted phosphoesterase
MRVHIFSDLHLEYLPINFPRSVTDGTLAELVLLAGDIHVKRRTVPWIARTFHQTAVAVGGNHEAYADSLFAMISASRQQAYDASRERDFPIGFLERELWSMRARDDTPVRILGATLWTDFELFGRERKFESSAEAWLGMNDYVYSKLRDPVTLEKRCLTPSDTAAFNAMTVKFLTTELEQKFDGVTIVVTHHAPSVRSLPEEERSDPLAPCYASALDEFIEQHQPHLWAHGHVHTPSDYKIGKTRIVCNPRGTPRGRSNAKFDPQLVIELK